MSMLPKSMIKQFSPASKIVFFTGAGISAESGIPTFRDKDGYWSQHNPLKMASIRGFREDPVLVWNWYLYRREKILAAQPNPGHIAITKFQAVFPNTAVVTQNIDGLHQRADNRDVYELHGNIFSSRCLECKKSLDFSERTEVTEKSIPRCECGGLARPGVVWFGEALPAKVLAVAFELARQADIFFSIGTSTEVYPAAQLPFEAKNHGARIIEINPNQTSLTSHADLTIQQPAGGILPKIYKEIHAVLA